MTTLRKAAQAALRIIELRRNLGNAEYDKQAEQAANDLRAVLAVESVRAALAEFDASLTDPALASVHQTAEPAQPVAWIQSNHLQLARQGVHFVRMAPTKHQSDYIPLYTADAIREAVLAEREAISKFCADVYEKSASRGRRVRPPARTIRPPPGGA